MKTRVKEYIDFIFEGYESNLRLKEIKEEINSNLIEKINDLVKQGLSSNDAYNQSIKGLGDKSEFVETFHLVKTKQKSKNILLKLVVLFTGIAAFLILGFVFDLWHPAWVIFVILLMVYITYEERFGALVMLAITLYLSLGIFFNYWLVGLSIFGITVSLMACKDKAIGGLWVLHIVLYISLSSIFDIWHPLWIIFILVAAITAVIKDKSWVAFSWLFSIAFYLAAGFIFSLWSVAWIIFILAVAFSTYIEQGKQKESKR